MLDSVLRDIESLRIQGASNVARAGLKVMDQVVRKSMVETKEDLIDELVSAGKRLIGVRETEPMLKNAVRFVIWRLKNTSSEDFKVKAREIIRGLHGSVDRAEQRVSEIGANIVKHDHVVLTHCHSSSVTKIIKAAKPKEVICTETRPLFQGRLTARELVKAGVKTKMIIDSAVADFIKKVDLVLLGCDAITPNSIINKVGSNGVSLLCEKYDIPLYICSTSYKFDPESVTGEGVGIEERSPREIWSLPPRGLKILNPAFDVISYDNITSFINELGLFSPDSLFISLKNTYKWMFEKIL